MKKNVKIAGVILFIVFVALYYYINLPAINIHSVGFWGFLIILFAAISIILSAKSILSSSKDKKIININVLKPNNKISKLFFLITILLVIILALGTLLSSPIINSKKYQRLITPQERNFTDDIKEISYNEIPLLDKSSATLLGSRKMGSMIEYVSQFEVSNEYNQINYQKTPVRVTPLEYGSIFKWFSNRKKGIPAYIKIDMATQNVDCIKLETGMKYSKSEHFGRNIYRYLRFKFPTYMFADINFEIDDNGTPYWICPVKTYTIGLFGGESIKNVVIVNAVTGEINNYKIDNVPTWVDRVYSAELLISYYDYYGTLKHGYFNTLFSQKDCLKTTDGYNYIAINDDVWVYTGVTSVGGDESNVGFVLMNQRTSETRYYSIAGAEEYSAMNSAEGQVQNLGYRATFPILLNIADNPTYFIALKDDAGLVKKYAMVNIAKYQIVAIGDTVNECEKTYVSLMKSNGIETSLNNTNNFSTIQGIITKLSQVVIEGNSHYYLMLDKSDDIFDINISECIDIIRYNIGDKITLNYNEDNNLNHVLNIEK